MSTTPTPSKIDALPVVGEREALSKDDTVFLCRIWGEIDHTLVAIAPNWEGVRQFCVRNYTGSEDHVDYYGKLTLETLKEEFDEHEADERGGAYEQTWEIGGLSIERVWACATPPPQVAQASRMTSLDRGEIAYQLTKRLIIDMPTARAAVDAAIPAGTAAHAATGVVEFRDDVDSLGGCGSPLCKACSHRLPVAATPAQQTQSDAVAGAVRLPLTDAQIDQLAADVCKVMPRPGHFVLTVPMLRQIIDAAPVTSPQQVTLEELPPLPGCYEFVYEFAGGKRKLDSDRYNGSKAVASRQVYTAEQMRTYGLACAATPPQQATPSELEVTCGRCGGSGDKEYLVGGGPDAYDEIGPCPDCQGTGAVTMPSAAASIKPEVQGEADPLAEECMRLQNALAFWMPNVPPADHPLHARIAADTYLLVGYDGPDTEPSAYEQGLIKFAAPIAQLIESWEDRSRKAFPTDSMLINKHIRELHAALKEAPGGGQ